MEENKCLECGAYNGHSPDCSLMSEEYAKSELKKYYFAWLDNDNKKQRIYQNFINRLVDERDKWKGKFMTVKNENNKLRKKLNNEKTK